MKKIIVSLLCSISMLAFAENSTNADQDPNKVNNVADRKAALPNNENNSIKWLVQPMFSQFKISQFPEGEYHLLFDIVSNENGQVSNVKLLQSSGITELDHYVQQTIYRGKLAPYAQDGAFIKYRVWQPFYIIVKKPKKTWWQKLFLL